MSKVALVTDSTASLPHQYIEQYGIRVVPNWLMWSGKEYRDGIDIQPAEFYQRLKTARELPTSAAVAPDVFKNAFEDLLADGYDVIGVFPSAKLSRVVDSAQQAKQMLANENIVVIDSRTSGMAVGWPVIRTARAAAAGANLSECEALVRHALENVGYFGTLDTLDYLQRWGRIGKAQHFLGTALNLKPILELVNGEAAGVERVRTRRKALERMLDLLQDRIGGRSPVYLAVMHTDVYAEAEALLEQASALVHPQEAVIAFFSATVGSHFGPGTVGFNFMAGVD